MRTLFKSLQYCFSRLYDTPPVPPKPSRHRLPRGFNWPSGAQEKGLFAKNGLDYS